MLNSYFLQKYAQMRHDEFLAEACRERLLRQIVRERPRLSQKIRRQVGEWLITLGYKLKPQLLIFTEKDMKAKLSLANLARTSEFRTSGGWGDCPDRDYPGQAG